MTQEELLKELKNYLKSIAPESDLLNFREEDLIMQKLGIDSFDFLQFIIKINEVLKVNIPEEDYGKVQTLKNLLEYLNKHPAFGKSD